MKLVIGLGNPGARYEATRHNIGASVVRAFADRAGMQFRKERLIKAVTAKVPVGQGFVICAVPSVFMNLSGEAVKPLAVRYNCDLSDVLIVYDDLDLDVGRIRIRPQGSAGGHNGVRSVIASLRSQEFARLRIGIGRPSHPAADTAEYVLSCFRKNEREVLGQAIEQACEAVAVWAVEGVQKSMNVFNRGVKDE